MEFMFKSALIGLCNYKLFDKLTSSAKSKKAFAAYDRNYDSIPPRKGGIKVNYYNLICVGNSEKSHKSDELLLNKDGKIQMTHIGNYIVDNNYIKNMKEIGVASRQAEIKCGKAVACQILQRCGKNILVKEKRELVDGIPAQATPGGIDPLVPNRNLYIDEAKFDHMFIYNIKKPLECAQKNGYTWLICSPNAIKYIICRALQIPVSAYNRFNISPGSITSMACYENGEIKLLRINDRTMFKYKQDELQE